MNDKLNKIIEKQQQQIEEPHKKEDDIVQLVGFIIGDEEYAVPILSIQEIIKPIEYTRVPSVPEYILGVFNLRGSVIPLIDLRRKFKMPPAKSNEDTRYIVMIGRDNTAGFVIDRLTEAIRIKSNKIGPPPETIHADKGMVYGIGMQDESILTILKVESLLKSLTIVLSNVDLLNAMRLSKNEKHKVETILNQIDLLLDHVQEGLVDSSEIDNPHFQ